MAKSTLVFLALVAATLAVTSAVSKEEMHEIKEAVIPLLQACGNDLGISKEDVMAAKKAKDIDALNPCFYACFFKKIGILDDSGLFDVAAAKERHSKYLKNEEDIEKATQIAETCASVNDQDVSDGAEGCERSKLLLACFIEGKHLFSHVAESE